jgi:hypothetical protein
MQPTEEQGAMPLLRKVGPLVRRREGGGATVAFINRLAQPPFAGHPCRPLEGALRSRHWAAHHVQVRFHTPSIHPQRLSC